MATLFTVLSGLLTAECWVLAIWGVSLTVALNLSSFDSIRAVPTGRERLLAKVPSVGLFMFGKRLPNSRARTPALVLLHSRASAHARVVDRAGDAAFAVPVLAGWVLVLLGIALVGVSIPLPEDGLSKWLVPLFFLLMNFSALLATLGLRQRAWTTRAPFEWRLYTLLTWQLFRVARAVARRRDDVVIEEVVLSGSRQVEHVLRLRFPVSASGESNRVAARVWDSRVRTLLAARADRVLGASGTQPETWFAAWSESVASAVLTPQVSAEVEGPETPAMLSESPSHKSVLAVSFTLFLIAVLGVAVTVFSPDAVAEIPWKDYLGLPAAVVAVLACGKFFSDFRRNRVREL